MARQGNSSAARAARMRATASYFGAGAIGASKLPVSLPVAPLLFAGTARLAGWNGSAAKVARTANPSTPQTFGFTADNRIDLAAIEAYVGGQNVSARVDTIFDQSGNGFDLVQATDGGRGKVYRSQLVGAALPITSSVNLTYPIPSGMSVDRANHSVFLVSKPHLARAYYTWTTIGGGLEFSSVNPDTTTPGGGIRVRDTVNNVNKTSSRIPITSTVSILGYSSGASDVKIYNNRVIETIAGAFASGALTGGSLNQANFAETIAFLVFPRALTAAEMTTVGAALEAICTPSFGQTKGVFMIGDSITAGQGTASVYVPGLGMNATEPDQLYAAIGSPSNVAIFNCGQPAIPITGLNTASGRSRIAEVFAAYPELTKKVARLHIGINDLRAGSSDTTVYNAIVAYSNYLRGLGVKLIVSTINANGEGSWTGAMETARVSVNNQIKANWATFADDMVDYDGISQLANPSDTTYFNADKIHQTASAYQLKSALVAPKIAALLA